MAKDRTSGKNITANDTIPWRRSNDDADQIEEQKSTGQASNVYAGFYTAEVADVSAGNHVVTIDGGVAKGVYTGADGDLEVITPNGETVVYPGLKAGGFYPIPCTTVKSGNTTIIPAATSILVGSW